MRGLSASNICVANLEEKRVKGLVRRSLPLGERKAETRIGKPVPKADRQTVLPARAEAAANR
jgi:hypothetical protein